jgi:UDP-N-acetylglucosamine--N-acetylmuramyl-(pentapeptide) pyrophosphoryl-undecaprenol N-acetylglucosamine transferase
LPIAHLKHLRISHQARTEDILRVADFYTNHGIEAEVQSFFNDIPRRMSEAQLVISRAGASSIADISVIGRPSILIPLGSAIRDEQTVNAQALVAANAAVLVPEQGLTVPGLSTVIADFLNAGAKATPMANAALRCAMPDATDRLMALVEDLAEALPEGDRQ